MKAFKLSIDFYHNGVFKRIDFAAETIEALRLYHFNWTCHIQHVNVSKIILQDFDSLKTLMVVYVERLENKCVNICGHKFNFS